MTLMGTGTSHGIPVIACDCPVCKSTDPKDTRLRCSAYITQKISNEQTKNIVIDTGPEFRIQALKYHIMRLDAVLLTHSHADHINGLDDLRAFCRNVPKNKYTERIKELNKKFCGDNSGLGLPVYANSVTIKDTKERFRYAFRETQEGGGVPKIQIIDNIVYTATQPLTIGTLEIIPIPMMHGKLETSGYLLSCRNSKGEKHSIAYLTDCNFIKSEYLSIIKTYSGYLDHLVIDGLRPSFHTTHCCFDEALQYADILKPAHTWLTHICHDMKNADIENYIMNHIVNYKNLEKIVKEGGSAKPAYDGLVLTA